MVEENKHNNLVLLIGSNPLPNYIIAKYELLQDTNIKIVLVYSTDTKKYATNIASILKCEPKMYSISDPFSKKEIENVTKQIIQNLSGSVHLNYTGGTKTMAVHIYNMFSNNKEEFDNVYFSYLNKNDFKIYFDDGRISDNLLAKIHLLPKQIAKLHDLSETNFQEKVTESQQILIHDILDYVKKDYEQFNDRIQILRRLYNEKNIKRLQNKIKNISKENSNKLGVILPLLEKTNILNHKTKCLKFNFDNKQLEIIKNEVGFLTGKWLEAYTFLILQECIKENNIEASNIKKSLVWNWESKINSLNLGKKSLKTFEIDVALIRGYQLTVISCTTSNQENRCKSKAFEVIHRSKQLGGDEAKAVLITFLEEKKINRFKNDLRNNINYENKFIVLSINILKDNIKDKLYEFIFSEE